MPRLNRAKNAHFYVTHGFSIRNNEIFRNYNLSDEGLRELYQKGYRDGDSFPHEVFHKLFEEGHIFYGNDWVEESESEPVIDLHERIRSFFNQDSAADCNPAGKLNNFKTLVIEATRISDWDRRSQIFLDLGIRTKPLSREFQNFIVRKCPGSVCRDMKMFFGLDEETFEKIRNGPAEEIIVAEKPEETLNDPVQNAEPDRQDPTSARDQDKPGTFDELKRLLNQCAQECVDKGITIEINIKISKNDHHSTSGMPT